MNRLTLALGPLVAISLFSFCSPPPVGGPGPARDAGEDAGLDAGADDAGEPISAPSNQWTWIPVEGSVCASGSTAGIGINVAESSDDLFIFMQGGGACWNQGTCVPSLLQYGPLCEYGTWCLLDAPGGQQPTSVHVTEADPYPRDGGGAFPQEITNLSHSRAFDRNDATNPFRNATFVYVPYCTGDLHAGNAVKTYPYKYGLFDEPKDYVFHFAGASNMQSYLARLKATFPNAKRIWLTGSSAGGFGATFNFERTQKAFPAADVRLLSDSGPFIQTPHWPEWRDTWQVQPPPACAECADGGMPAWMDDLAERYGSKMGLLAYDQDKVIAYYFFAPPGAGYALNPPVGAYSSALGSLLEQYDTRPNTTYFVVPGDQHVLWGDYGMALPDGGYTAPRPSADGGTDLKAWIDAWAEG